MPRKARTGWSHEEDDLDAEQQNAESRCPKRDLNIKLRLRPPQYH